MLSTKHAIKWILSLYGGSDGRLGEPGWCPGEHIMWCQDWNLCYLYLPLLYLTFHIFSANEGALGIPVLSGVSGASEWLSEWPSDLLTYVFTSGNLRFSSQDHYSLRHSRHKTLSRTHTHTSTHTRTHTHTLSSNTINLSHILVAHTHTLLSNTISLSDILFLAHTHTRLCNSYYFVIFRIFQAIHLIGAFEITRTCFFRSILDFQYSSPVKNIAVWW